MFAPISGLSRRSLFLPLSFLWRSNVQLTALARLSRPSHIVRSVQTVRKRPTTWLYKSATVAGLGIGLCVLQRPSITCDGPSQPPVVQQSNFPSDYPPPPESSVSLYELGFGTVAGLCAGVFVKKGAKAVAWFLGGIFVLLQYLGSRSLIRVDWSKISSRFENLLYTTKESGVQKALTIGSLWRWIVDFLTADFQPRASFIAGFALGIRIG